MFCLGEEDILEVTMSKGKRTLKRGQEELCESIHLVSQETSHATYGMNHNRSLTQGNSHEGKWGTKGLQGFPQKRDECGIQKLVSKGALNMTWR